MGGTGSVPEVVAVPGSVPSIRRRSPPGPRVEYQHRPEVVAVPGSVPSISRTTYDAVPKPTAGPGPVGRFMFALGFIPRAELDSANSTIAGLDSQVAQLKADIAQLQSQIQSLTTQLTPLDAKVSSLQAQLKQLQAQIATLTSQVQDERSTVATLQGDIRADLQKITAMNGSIAGVASSLDAITSKITGVLAAPPAPSRSDPYTSVASQYPNGISDPDFGTLYPEANAQGAYAYAPGTLGFSPGYSGLGTSTGAVYFQAVGVLGSGKYGGRLATALGYVPASDLTDPAATIASLQSQVATLTTQKEGLQAQVSNLNGRIASDNSLIAALQQQVATAKSTVSSLTSQSTTLQGQVSSLTAQHKSNLAQISALQSQLQTLTTEYAAWQQVLASDSLGIPALPVSFSWTFGDGSSSSGKTPSHTYGNPGAYTVSVTISVRAPNKTYTRTLSNGFLIGQWPHSIYIRGGGATYQGIIYATVYDLQGKTMSGIHVLYLSRDPAGLKTASGVATTDGTGTVNFPYHGAGTVRLVVVRNPLVNGKSGLAVY